MFISNHGLITTRFYGGSWRGLKHMQQTDWPFLSAVPHNTKMWCSPLKMLAPSPLTWYMAHFTQYTDTDSVANVREVCSIRMKSLQRLSGQWTFGAGENMWYSYWVAERNLWRTCLLYVDPAKQTPYEECAYHGVKFQIGVFHIKIPLLNIYGIEKKCFKQLFSFFLKTIRPLSGCVASPNILFCMSITNTLMGPPIKMVPWKRAPAMQCLSFVS